MLRDKVKNFINMGVSLKTISTFANIHYTTLSKWINNEREMNINNQKKVEQALEIIIQKLSKIFYN